MANNDNHGPWGSGSSHNTHNTGNGNGGGNPWTRPSSGSGGPSSQGTPPDFDKVMDDLRRQFQQWHGGTGGPMRFAGRLFAGAVVLWLLSGIYQVGADQQGVVMRFGAYDRTEGAGLRYHLPYPIEDVLLPTVTAQNEIQIGFRRSGRTGDIVTVDEESMMLTQDQNIANVEFTVFWRINDIQKFLFEIRDTEKFIKMAAESVMREVIGQSKLQFALTDGRSSIADSARTRLQGLVDSYNAGVVISQVNLQTVSVPNEVKAAFQDVVNARLDQERFQNEAEAHANKVVPEAKGQAARITQEAMAYRDQKIAIAQGEADRFKAVLSAYAMAKDVTSKRLYLETMESVLSNANKIILDKNAGGSVSYLPLGDMLKQKSDGAAR